MVSWLWFFIGLIVAELFHTATKVPRWVTYPVVLGVVYVFYIIGALPLGGT